MCVLYIERGGLKTLKLRWLCLFVAFGLSLQAANIVTNPGFETGDFTGWTATPFPGGDLSIQTNLPNSGTYYARFGSNVLDGYDSLQQSLPTTAGVYYDLSFFLREDGPGSPANADFQVYFDGNLIQDVPGSNFVYTQFSFLSLLATTNSTVLEFRGFDIASYARLDDVSVDVSAVPEPATLVLVGAGVLLVTALRKRRAAV